MSNDVLTRLQAMYHSEQLLSYLVAKLPERNLTTGWIEQGLVHTGLAGNLLDKKNQEDLVIPVDRFVRLISEIQSKIDFGFFITGTHDKSKHVAIVSNKKIRGIASNIAIGLNIGNLQTSELFALVIRILSEKNAPTIDDPNLDYVEELVSDAAKGDVTHLISLSVHSGKQSPLDRIKTIMKTDLNSENVLAQSGDLQEITQPVLIFSRWLLGLDIFTKTKNAIASILLVQGEQITLFFWDASQKIATFAILEGVPLNTILWKYVHPLWYTLPVQFKEESTGPTVVVEKVKTHTQKDKSIDRRKKSDSDSPSPQSISIVRTLLTEIESRISPTVNQLHILNKRIHKMTRDPRFESMSENSESAIEELRRIEKETKILEDISVRFKELEKQLELTTSSGHSSSQLSTVEIQKIVSKMTALRALMDKIDLEVRHLDTRVTDIESLKFKRRTES